MLTGRSCCMERRDRILLEKVLRELAVAREMMADSSLDEFLQNEMLMRATSMTVINFGELVKNLTEETRFANPQVPWKAIAGFRDIAAHQYQTLRMEDVYETVTADFPLLREQIKAILQREDEA